MTNVLVSSISEFDGLAAEILRMECHTSCYYCDVVCGERPSFNIFKPNAWNVAKTFMRFFTKFCMGQFSHMRFPIYLGLELAETFHY